MLEKCAQMDIFNCRKVVITAQFLYSLDMWRYCIFISQI